MRRPDKTYTEMKLSKKFKLALISAKLRHAIDDLECDKGAFLRAIEKIDDRIYRLRNKLGNNEADLQGTRIHKLK